MSERFYIVTSLEQLFSSSSEKKTGILSFFRWSSAGIRTKILAPLIVLMFFSLLGSTVGFILSTNTTRNDILDGQLHEEVNRLTIALEQSERDVKNSAVALARDPELVAALQEDYPGNVDAIMRMDSRSVLVRDRFRLDQVVVVNTQDSVRVNITTYSELSTIEFHTQKLVQTCWDASQVQVIEVKDTTLLVGCAPIWAADTQTAQPKRDIIGLIYTVQNIPKVLDRFRRELGLTAEVEFVSIEQAKAANLPLVQSQTSANGHRLLVKPQSVAGTEAELVLRLSEQAINKIVGSGFTVMLISSGVTFLLVLTVGIWLAQSFTQPVLKLDKVAQAVAAGDLEQRVHFHHDDEFGRLGRSFDQATVTIQHLLEEQVRTAGERHAILQSMADGLLAVDKEEHIIMINPVAASLLGQPRDHLLGKYLHVLTDVEDHVLSMGLQQVVEQVRMELTDLDRDRTEDHITLGERVVRMHSAPTLGSENRITGAVVVLQDITQAVEADRAKSAFIGTASHELRTPLASMKGFVDIFYMSGIDNLNENQQMFLDTIKRQTENMVQLVNDLLEMARLEQGSLRGEQQWVSMPTALDEAITSLKIQLTNREIHLYTDMQESIPHIWIDSMHLRRILTNLVSNAVKYVHQGGNVHVRVYELHDPALLPSPVGEQPWKYKEPRSVVIEVEDNGVGIKASDQDKIFTRFFRSENELSVEAGGSGLGLAITRSLVHLHHGQIGFHSVEKEGTCFWVRLPAPSTELFDEDYASPQTYEKVDVA